MDEQTKTDHEILNELEQYLPGERLLAPSDSKWFQIVDSVDANTPMDGDDDAIKEEKARRVLGNLLSIRALVISPAFREMEAQMFRRARQICDQEIWQALATGDQNRILALRAERNGIMLFFQQFTDVSSDIEKLQAAFPQDQDDPEKRAAGHNQENP